MVINILKAARHFIFNKNAQKNFKNQSALNKVLRPFIAASFIQNRTSFIHIFSYLSGAFRQHQKLRILAHHYTFLSATFSQNQLRNLFFTGIDCYIDFDAENKYSVVLSFSSMLEFEGSLSLIYKVNNAEIAHLSFSIAPGDLFDIDDDNVLFIACLQKNGALQSSINMATKHFKDIDPARILMKVLESLADTLSISTCIGVSAANQLTAIKHSTVEKFSSIYDELWIENGGILKNGDYIISLPLPQKSLLAIKQTHRNRAIKKRGRLLEIYNSVHQNMQRNLLKSNDLIIYPLNRAS
ncbi:DUF535 family protein [Mucilaginibacter sp. FT3.2]|uniref:DUF535 family protein n=1 Tax=Mucilaginibacter sp. FT3.2 TaxID=2723090 RepID=UPI001621437F|nr:DUF535 family protein [Mucilaginibacter sp. FT3.2]MBB6233392.1 uncharacterized protein VirK/YbjX [Mucilaginibacter sp. FT3.2]